MRKTDLRRVDLNLLVVLQALLEERSVTRAAGRLAMSQPAASRALARLRQLFGDALLVEGPGGYLLTARAEEMQPLLRDTLARVGSLLAGSAFDPLQAAGPVRLLMLDLEAAVAADAAMHIVGEDAQGTGHADHDIPNQVFSTPATRRAAERPTSPTRCNGQ